MRALVLYLRFSILIFYHWLRRSGFACKISSNSLVLRAARIVTGFPRGSVHPETRCTGILRAPFLGRTRTPALRGREFLEVKWVADARFDANFSRFRQILVAVWSPLAIPLSPDTPFASTAKAEATSSLRAGTAKFQTSGSLIGHRN